MKWFVAALVMECRVGRAAPELWDEQIVVLRARTADEAYRKAVEAGRAANADYRNAAGERVRVAVQRPRIARRAGIFEHTFWNRDLQPAVAWRTPLHRSKANTDRFLGSQESSSHG